MSDANAPDQSQAFALLATFLDTTPATAAKPFRIPWLPTGGTLPQFNRQLGGHRPAAILVMGLHSLGQVIFINNPVSGLLLLLALFWQSPAMGMLSTFGIPAANVTARVIGCDRAARLNGLYGFNGALVGSAVAAFARFDAAANLLIWSLAVGPERPSPRCWSKAWGDGW